jgi:hypothetical protein
MKVYKLRFTQDDFVSKEPNVWRTDVIDLYDNNQYKNYSARRAPYGSNLLGNGVYTGLNSGDSINSEIGYIDSGRFVDTSGSIDILTWSVSLSQPAQANVDIKLNLYSTSTAGQVPYYDSINPAMVNDWATSLDLEPGSTIYKFESERYCFFELDFVSDAAIDLDADVELIIGVEIYSPAVNGFFPGTRRVLDKFPEWMEMREYDPEDINDDNKATPTKLGSLFINSVAGEWLTDLRGKITYEEFQRHIENVDLDQKAWVYRSSAVPQHIWSAKFNNGSGDIQLTYTSSIGEFYDCDSSDDAFFYNEATSEIYTIKEYDSLKLNNEEYAQELFQVWNSLDDIGVAVDLFRLTGESNDSFKKRILDVYINKPGVTAERFKTALRRELNLWKYEGYEPDSYYLGATPEVLTIEDIEKSGSYFDASGVPKESFYNLVAKLAKKYPMTWGLFRYGEALWDVDGLYHKGMAVVPKQFDAATPSLSDYQSGVGDINDLLVLPPDFHKEEQEFDITLAVRGKRPVPTLRHSEIRFRANVTGISSYTTAEYDPVTSPFYIEIVSGGVAYIANITLSASFYGGDPGIINLDTYSIGVLWPPVNMPEAITRFEWYTPGGETSSFLQWYRKSDGLIIDNQFLTSTITNVKVYPQFWDPATQTASGAIDSNYYNLKFNDSSLVSKIGYGGVTPLQEASPNFLTEDLTLQFQAYDFTVNVGNPEGFISTPQSVEVVVNKNNQLDPCIINVGNFNFPDYNDSGSPIHKVKVEVVEQNSNGARGVFVNGESELFIPANGNLSLNGSSVWTNGIKTITLGSPLALGDTVALTFACSTAPDYPESVPVWEPLYATQVVPLSGNKVNEHGPYRYGLTPRVNNSSFVLDNLRLWRYDFGLLPGDIVTWIGVDNVSNDNVLVWVDTNTIIPYSGVISDSGGWSMSDWSLIDWSLAEFGEPSDPESEEDYPDNALSERSNGYFGPLSIYAKLRPNINPEWSPFFHTGWFYEDQQEYYLYADPESATLSSGNVLPLSSQPQQGAPIIVETDSGSQLRQVAKFGSSTPLYFSEEKVGTGTDSLFVGYDFITDVVVYDKSTAQPVSTTNTSYFTNEIKTTVPTDENHTYLITYKPRQSFYADSLSTPGYTNLIFAEAADSDPYTVTWEASEFNPAKKLQLPLHPIYTSMQEGFIYIDHNEQTLSYVEAQVSPSVMLATPGEYALVTLSAYDKYGNPKPNVEFQVSHPGNVTLSETSVTTDSSGQAFLYVEANTTSVSGSLSAAPQGYPVSPISISYRVRKLTTQKNKVVGVMDSNQIVADGDSGTTLFGYVYDLDDNPVVGASVYWRKARDMKALLVDTSTSSSMATPGQNGTAGRVITDSNGRFTVGPFISHDEPGYWLVSVETLVPPAGDVTYWYEYLNGTSILESISLQPYPYIQQATPAGYYERYYATPAYPVTLDERDYQSTPTSAGPEWSPPSWFPISRYTQYQMGLLGSGYYNYDATATPDYDDFVES